jgi:hypothetical protein
MPDRPLLLLGGVLYTSTHLKISGGLHLTTSPSPALLQSPPPGLNPFSAFQLCLQTTGLHQVLTCRRRSDFQTLSPASPPPPGVFSPGLPSQGASDSPFKFRFKAHHPQGVQGIHQGGRKPSQGRPPLQSQGAQLILTHRVLLVDTP